MPRLVLHPGFHKSGTSSAQHLLWRNRKLLLPHVEIFQIRHLREVAEPALRYSRSRSPLDLMDWAELLDAAFKATGPREGRHILVSHEGLSGHLPGWPGVEDYGAVPVLLTYLCEYLRERFPDHEQYLVLTTRDPDAWLWSAYRHHLRGQRLTREWEDFRADHAPASDLGAVLEEIREALPGAILREARLEITRALPLGPAASILAPLDLPASAHEALVPVPAGNRGPEAQLATQFLTLNRSELTDDEVAARKEQLASAAGVGGWVR